MSTGILKTSNYTQTVSFTGFSITGNSRNNPTRVTKACDWIDLKTGTKVASNTTQYVFTFQTDYLNGVGLIIK
jgi:hypothetical protein